ncbi:interferon omega-1-like [Pteropus medius]|uniref:Interferon omega-1-like n=1 Tax=Pteropus vampyrus TaxID=132908 RepID=A0A6P3RTX9_PTEVA|nr:interferon omega-1-like [Pteropus vampyrus]XP_011385799.1 interferon omega-1-like [Pteropus vampyrus]XP_039702963.1 interferon omega-1-like [Pteropus giganteus]
MAPLLSLITAMLVFSYGPSGSLSCDLSQNHVQVNKESIVLLHQMQRISSFRCRKDRKNFGFPQEMVDGSQVQEAQAISVLHEMLQETSNVFGSEHSSAAWNTTVLHGLLSRLHWQLEDLGTCLVLQMKEAESALGMEAPTLAVKRYFQGIRLYLKEKQYSDCAWEIVRVEIKRAFSLSTNLREMLRNQDGDLRSP